MKGDLVVVCHHVDLEDVEEDLWRTVLGVPLGHPHGDVKYNADVLILAELIALIVELGALQELAGSSSVVQGNLDCLL